MTQSTTITVAPTEFHLCFRSLFRIGRGFVFPCDAAGHVQVTQLSAQERDNYVFAQAMIGRELQMPAIERNFTTQNALRDGAVYPPQHASVWTI